MRVLGKLDPARARVVLDQYRTLYPELGPEPWRERFAELDRALPPAPAPAPSYPEHLVFVSKSAKAAFAAFAPADRSEVIYNAPAPGLSRPGADRLAEVRSIAGVREKTKLLVSVGTLCERKGQTDLAAALGRIAPESAGNLSVAFIGEADPAYAAKVRQSLPSSFKGRILFTGPSTDAAAWIAAADALVNTSRSEAFPRTFLEAAVMGTPIIASAVDGATERLSDGVSALFYRPGDIAGLAAQITRLLADQETGRALAEVARKDLAEAWAWPDMIAAYVRLLPRPGPRETPV